MGTNVEFAGAPMRATPTHPLCRTRPSMRRSPDTASARRGLGIGAPAGGAKSGSACCLCGGLWSQRRLRDRTDGFARSDPMHDCARIGSPPVHTLELHAEGYAVEPGHVVGDAADIAV